MLFEKSYARYWAEDVVFELGYDYRDKHLVDWILRWMKRTELEPEQESVAHISDICKEEFEKYLQKGKNVHNSGY